MANTVFCRKYKQQLPALDQPPAPGAAGLEIFENTSKQAWEAWLEHQTRLVNEKQLNMMDKKDRSYLIEQRERFLTDQDFDAAEGYVPEK